MPPRFLLDSMLGTLASRLRMLGVDAAYAPHAEDNELRYRCRAEGRILLTRDRPLATAMGEGAFLVDGHGVDQEYASIVPFLMEKIDDLQALVPMSRCLECNGLLQGLVPDRARGKVPDHVFRTAREFWTCPDCGKVYWRGTHRANMEQMVREMMEPLKTGPEGQAKSGS